VGALDWHVLRSASADSPDASRGAEAPAAGRPPCVLLLHGTAGSIHQWARILPAIAGDALVIAPDLPGHGATRPAAGAGAPVPAGCLTLPGMASAVAELLQALGVRPSLIVGHSAGAAVALRMVLDGVATPAQVIGLNPALIPPPDFWVDLLAPFAGVVMESSWLARSAAWVARQGGVVHSVLASSGARLSPEQVVPYERLFADPAHCAAALAMMSRWNLPALVRDAASLTVPFTALAGARDRWVPPEPLAAQIARIPHARMEIVPEVGHLLPEEAPGRVIEAIRVALHEARPAREG
jgi:magnesium chelatase accessory protein